MRGRDFDHVRQLGEGVSVLALGVGGPVADEKGNGGGKEEGLHGS